MCGMQRPSRHHDDLDSSEEDEEGPVFVPYTRESLIESEARIAEEEAKRNERKKKREEGEVCRCYTPAANSFPVIYSSFIPAHC